MTRAAKLLEELDIEDLINSLTQEGWVVISKSEPHFQSIVLKSKAARLTLFRGEYKKGDQTKRAVLKDGTIVQASLINRLLKKSGWLFTST